eukprot:2164554-Amphidinium_carterae.1
MATVSELDLDCFSGTPSKEAVRVVLGVGAVNGFPVIPADFLTAFMHTTLENGAPSGAGEPTRRWYGFCSKPSTAYVQLHSSSTSIC